jgi:predicted ArsR family transcriptional regulator
MAQLSDPFFCTFHALRLKGFAKADTIAEVADLPQVVVEEHLSTLEQREWAAFREARQLWQLTALGRDEYQLSLLEDVGGAQLLDSLSGPYEAFLAIDEQFKALCSDWQLRDGEPNDHLDEAYDAVVLQRLVDLNVVAAPVVEALGDVLVRLAAYGPRLARTCQRVVKGETRMFTGVMCGSYHDVWMELHEDLILTQGIDRAVEGSH